MAWWQDSEVGFYCSQPGTKSLCVKGVPFSVNLYLPLQKSGPGQFLCPPSSRASPHHSLPSAIMGLLSVLLLFAQWLKAFFSYRTDSSRQGFIRKEMALSSLRPAAHGRLSSSSSPTHLMEVHEAKSLSVATNSLCACILGTSKSNNSPFSLSTQLEILAQISLLLWWFCLLPTLSPRKVSAYISLEVPVFPQIISLLP